MIVYVLVLVHHANCKENLLRLNFLLLRQRIPTIVQARMKSSHMLMHTKNIHEGILF